MSVGVHRDRNATVAHLTLDVLGVFPLCNEQTCIGVSQIVESDSWKPSPPQCRQEAPVEHIRCSFGGSKLRREDKIKFTDGASLLPAFEFVKEFWSQVYLAV